MVSLPSSGDYYLEMWQAGTAADNEVQFLVTDLRNTTAATVGALMSATLDDASPVAYDRSQAVKISVAVGRDLGGRVAIELVVVEPESQSVALTAGSTSSLPYDCRWRR